MQGLFQEQLSAPTYPKLLFMAVMRTLDVFCAMGYSGAQFDQNDVELFFESENGRLQVFDHGTPIVFDEEKALQIMKADAVTVTLTCMREKQRRQPGAVT